MTTEAAITSTFPLSKRNAVTLTVGPAGCVCEWSPHMPPEHGLNHAEVRAYKRGRKKLLDEFAKKFGPVVVIDI